MAEEKAGVTDDQVADGQGVQAQSATEQGVQGQVAAGTNQDENRIPLSRLNEEIQKRKDAESAQTTAEQQVQLARDQMAVMQAAPVQAQAQPKTTYEQAMADCNVTAEDLSLYPEKMVDVMNKKEQLDRAINAQQANQFTNQTFINAHPDYGDVVGRVGPTGQTIPSAEITEILQRKPHLTAAAYASSQGAYNIVMDERKLTKFEKDKAALDEHKNRQELDNETQPLGGSAAGGGTAGDVQQKMMTREQVLEVEAKLARGEAV